MIVNCLQILREMLRMPHASQQHYIIRTVVRIVGMGRMSHICNTKCSRL